MLRVHISEANSGEGNDVVVKAFCETPTFGHHLSSCCDDKKQQKFDDTESQAFHVEAARRAAPPQTPGLEGCDETSLATHHVLANQFKQKDGDWNATQGVQNAQDFTKECHWNHIPVTCRNEKELTLKIRPPYNR